MWQSSLDTFTTYISFEYSNTLVQTLNQSIGCSRSIIIVNIE